MFGGHSRRVNNEIKCSETLVAAVNSVRVTKKIAVKKSNMFYKNKVWGISRFLYGHFKLIKKGFQLLHLFLWADRLLLVIKMTTVVSFGKLVETDETVTCQQHKQ